MLTEQLLDGYSEKLKKMGALSTHQTEILLNEVKELQKDLIQARQLTRVYAEYFAYHEEVKALRLPWEINNAKTNKI